jgi:hypothetical protein
MAKVSTPRSATEWQKALAELVEAEEIRRGRPLRHEEWAVLLDKVSVK